MTGSAGIAVLALARELAAAGLILVCFFVAASAPVAVTTVRAAVIINLVICDIAHLLVQLSETRLECGCVPPEMNTGTGTSLARTIFKKP